MAHLRTYNIFPDKWIKNFTQTELNNARLTLKAYITNKETELGIKEVSIFKFFKTVLVGYPRFSKSWPLEEENYQRNEVFLWK